jgi:hypothetical protein
VFAGRRRAALLFFFREFKKHGRLERTFEVQMFFALGLSLQQIMHLSLTQFSNE